MLFMYLACPGTTSFPTICGASLFNSLCLQRIKLLFELGPAHEKFGVLTGPSKQNLKLLQERMNLSSSQRLPLGILIKIAIIEKSWKARGGR